MSTSHLSPGKCADALREDRGVARKAAIQRDRAEVLRALLDGPASPYRIRIAAGFSGSDMVYRHLVVLQRQGLVARDANGKWRAIL